MTHFKYITDHLLPAWAHQYGYRLERLTRDNPQ